MIRWLLARLRRRHWPEICATGNGRVVCVQRIR